jgi:hypothetical protein
VDPKRIAEILGDLANASEADIKAALSAVRERGIELAQNAPSKENVEALRGVKANAQQLAGALTERSQLAADQAAALAELDGVHDPSRDNIPQPDKDSQAAVPSGADQGKPAEPAAAPVGDGGEGGQPADGEQGNGEQSGQLAAKRRTSLAKLGTDGSPEVPEAGQFVNAKTVVRGGVPGMEAGTKLDDATFLTAFAAKINASGGMGRQEVARTEFAYPAERTLGTDPAQNTERIAAATSQEAIVAAGGLCLPPEVRYDIRVLGVTDRPVKSALNAFRTERGVIQYRAPFDALAMTTGLGIWTQADDQAIVEPPADPDTNVYKSCYVVDCPGVLEASIYSTYMCLEFPNMTARFDTEWVSATTQAAQIAWSRLAENQLLTQLNAGSKVLKGLGGVISAIADLLTTYDRVIAYYRNRHRLNSTVALRTIMPQWVINLLRTDLARRMTMASPADLFAIAQAQIEQWFTTRNVNVTWHLDGLNASTASGVSFAQQWYADSTAGAMVPSYPANVDALLFVEGDWLFLDGGTLDLGLVRDSQLNARNRYQTFVETFEGVLFEGKESLRFQMPLRPDGSAAGTKAVPTGGWLDTAS